MTPSSRRLAEAGVSALDVFATVCGVLHYLEVTPGVLPDQKAEDVAISRAVVALAKQPKKTSFASGQRRTYSARSNSSCLHWLGKHLREQLAPLALQVRIAVKANEQRKSMTAAQTEAERRAPFITG